MLPSVRYTHNFVRECLPKGARRILEIGCGSGELAASLIADRLEVTAIDADAEAVAKAQRIGVDAKIMSWPAPLDERFEAVLFTRSLHHVEDLSRSIAAATGVFDACGRIIVEDFRAEGGSERSARWFKALVRELHDCGGLSQDTTIERLLDKAAPSSTHGHHLHSSADIRRELSHLKTVLEDDAAYYFRYLEPVLTKPDAAEKMLQLELELIAKGRIDALGKRFVVESR